jgi:hypothetical protein
VQDKVGRKADEQRGADRLNPEPLRGRGTAASETALLRATVVGATASRVVEVVDAVIVAVVVVIMGMVVGMVMGMVMVMCVVVSMSVIMVVVMVVVMERALLGGGGGLGNLGISLMLVVVATVRV